MKKLMLFLTAMLFSTLAIGMDIAVYDGYMNDYDPPRLVFAACSDPTCFGFIGVAQTGAVTHSRNPVGWGAGSVDDRAYLFVDGKQSDSAKVGELLTLRTNNLSAGPHTVQGMVVSFGVQQWSTAVTIYVVK